MPAVDAALSHHRSRFPATVRPVIESDPGPTPASRRSDAAIAAYATERHGIVTLAELEALGLSARGVRHRVATGRLHRLHRGVYSQGRPSREGRWMAAVLASGTGALLSHRSAAALWGIRPETGPRIDVTVAGSTGRAHPTIAAHSGARIASADVSRRDGIPCTSLARTLLDLAAVVDRSALARAIDRSEELRAFDLDAIEEVLDRCRRRPGTVALRAALADYAGATDLRSVAEERFLALVVDAGLPRPRANRWIPLDAGDGYRPDFLWPEQSLIVEVDGRTHHARSQAFRHDRRRDRRLALAGYETLRFDAAEVLDAPDRVARELRALLAR
jgi:very-short-patch-repair endonuclease/predicted transcriptional regulator of viral defense system